MFYMENKLMNNKKKNITILLLCIVNVLILSIGHVLNNNSIVLFSLFSFFTLLFISPKSLFLALVLFYLPWSPIMKLSPEGYTFYTIGLALFFIFLLFTKELFDNKGILTLKNLILICTLFVYTMIIKFFLGYSVSFNYLMFLLMLVLTPSYLFMYHKKISFEASIIFFSIGIVTAGFSSKILMDYPHMLDFINISQWETIGLTRLSGFYGDANFYSAHILVAIGGLLILILRKRLYDVIILFVLVITLIYLGFLSVSKMFLLVLILFLALWGLTVLFSKGKLTTKFTVILICVVGVCIINTFEIFTRQINMYLVRFTMVSDVSSLTTGRSNILDDYYSFFYNNPVALLFGQGFTNVYKGEISNAAHNTIIQVVYQFGLVGSLLLTIWIVRLFMLINKPKKPSLKKYNSFNIYSILLAIVCFAPWLSLDILFADEFFFITSLFLIGKNYLTDREHDF